MCINHPGEERASQAEASWQRPITGYMTDRREGRRTPLRASSFASLPPARCLFASWLHEGREGFRAETGKALAWRAPLIGFARHARWGQS